MARTGARYTSGLAVAAALTLLADTVAPAAAEPRRETLPDISVLLATPQTGNQLWNTAVSRARANAAANTVETGLGPDQELAPRSVLVDTDADATQHVRFDRRWHGLPVLGGDLVVHQSPDGAFQSADGYLATTPESDEPRVSAERASRLALREARRRLASAPSSGLAAPRLAVDAFGAEPVLVWDTLVTGTADDATPSRLHVLVDAATGRIRNRYDEVHTVRDRQDRAEQRPAPTPATGQGNGLRLGRVGLDTVRADGSYQLVDPVRGSTSVHDEQRVEGRQVGKVFTDADNQWGDGTLADPATVAVDAQAAAANTWDFYRAAFGRLGVRGDAKGPRLRVHYGNEFRNAYWDDECFCARFGDGRGNTKPFVSLDFVAHELSHGFNKATANLVYTGEAGGLNEANSDIMGTLAEFHAQHPADPGDYLIAEELDLWGDGRPLRRMDHPSTDSYQSPDCWSKAVAGYDPHKSSGIGRHWFYLLAEGSGEKTVNGVAYSSPTCDGSTLDGIGRDEAGKVWFRAMTTYLTSKSTYADARRATVRAAGDVFGATDPRTAAVRETWTAVGVE